jgi:hypothetical protein
VLKKVVSQYLRKSETISIVILADFIFRQITPLLNMTGLWDILIAAIRCTDKLAYANHD